MAGHQLSYEEIKSRIDEPTAQLMKQFLWNVQLKSGYKAKCWGSKWIGVVGQQDWKKDAGMEVKWVQLRVEGTLQSTFSNAYGAPRVTLKALSPYVVKMKIGTYR